MICTCTVQYSTRTCTVVACFSPFNEVRYYDRKALTQHWNHGDEKIIKIIKEDEKK